MPLSHHPIENTYKILKKKETRTLQSRRQETWAATTKALKLIGGVASRERMETYPSWYPFSHLSSCTYLFRSLYLTIS
jgi:hypothetical protein